MKKNLLFFSFVSFLILFAGNLNVVKAETACPTYIKEVTKWSTCSGGQSYALDEGIVYATTSATVNVKALVVGGGGGGGVDRAGGGGAGGYIFSSSIPVTDKTYNITVGSGGSGGVNGGNSLFSTLTAIGGGAGGAWANGIAGGSGGGAGCNYATTKPLGGAGTSGQGYSGADSYSAVDNPRNSGGGGGSSYSGFGGAGAPNGGYGTINSISGADVIYAAGGGGGDAGYGRTSPGKGTGGSSIGGNGGGKLSTDKDATNGAVNTGSGGGGAGNDGTPGTAGSGGSGIVIIRYNTADFGVVTGGTETIIGSETVRTFTSSGSITFTEPQNYFCPADVPTVKSCTPPPVYTCDDGNQSSVVDHDNSDWTIDSTIDVAGKHINVGTFKVGTLGIAKVKPFDGTNCGSLEVHAKNIIVQGAITASGAGYGGGGGGGGLPGASGETYTGVNVGTMGSGGAGKSGGLGGSSASTLGSGAGGSGGGSCGGTGGTSVLLSQNAGMTNDGWCVTKYTSTTYNGNNASSTGKYSCSVLSDTNDTSVWMGSGGAGGSGGTGAFIEYNCNANAAGGGGGAGGPGGGVIKLTAEESINISGNVYSTGVKNAGNGTAGGAAARTCDSHGDGGAGGDANLTGSSAAGAAGTCPSASSFSGTNACGASTNYCFPGAAGGAGSGGAGGGILLSTTKATSTLTITGAINNQGSEGATNGGTLKIFSCAEPTISGTLTNGRLYKNVDPLCAATTTPIDFTASCSASPTIANIGDTVTWTATSSSPTATYSWLGTNLAGKTGRIATTSYTTNGIYFATTTVSDGISTTTVGCTGDVAGGTTPPSGCTDSCCSGNCTCIGNCNPVLTVNKLGAGAGVISDFTEEKINCGTGVTDCSETVSKNSSLTLNTTAGSGSTFAGWSGDIGSCSANSTSCMVTMDASKTINATFNLSEVVPANEISCASLEMTNPHTSPVNINQNITWTLTYSVSTSTAPSLWTFTDANGVTSASSTSNVLNKTFDTVGRKTVRGRFYDPATGTAGGECSKFVDIVHEGGSNRER